MRRILINKTITKLLSLSYFENPVLLRCYGKSSVRVRFAPSPTGFLHLGGLRTAFYNKLFATKNKGKFILRIEDTDQKRIKPGSIENLNSMLEWTGLLPDESPYLGGPFGPYVQSQRLEMYRGKANCLLEMGHAYRCFCSETRLDLVKKEAFRNRQNPGYDNKCRLLSDSEIKQCLQEGLPYTIRFKIKEGPVTFEDIVFGHYALDVSENEGDFIIIKSDGFPTYHFACIVDDHFMNISHVLRGAEWLMSTPKHLMLHDAFGWQPPTFAHLPLLINSDRTKLSKRQEAIGVEYFKTKSYSPEAILNFLARAGGGFGKQEGSDVYDLSVLASKFNLDEVNTNSCILDLKKLDEYNQSHLMQQLLSDLSMKALIVKLRTMLKEKFGERYSLEQENLPDSFLEKILLCYKGRISNLSELVSPDMEYMWVSLRVNEILKLLLKLNIPEPDLYLKIIAPHLSSLSDEEFTESNLVKVLKELCEREKISYVSVMRMLRIVLTGKKDGPGVCEILIMLGQERSLKKINLLLNHIELQEAEGSNI